jgi:hypothetical protein
MRDISSYGRVNYELICNEKIFDLYSSLNAGITYAELE